MSLLDALGAVLGERADPGWWQPREGEPADAHQARTAAALRALDCSRSWNRATPRDRTEALAALLRTEPEREP